MAKYIIELDLIIGYSSKTDRLHEIASSMMTKIKQGVFDKVFLPASALLEYSLYLKSRKIGLMEIEKVIVGWNQFPNIIITELNGSIITESIKLQIKYDLSYFDSLHAASAIHENAFLVGTDADFENIKGLTFVDVNQLNNN